MATRRRDIAPAGKHTQLKPNPTPQNHDPPPPPKTTPIRSRSVARGPSGDAKQLPLKKPTPPDSTARGKPAPRTLGKTPRAAPNNLQKPSTGARDTTPLPAASNPQARARDKTPLPEQKIRHVPVNSLRSRDATPQPERKTPVPIVNPPTKPRDKTPLPSRKMPVPSNTTSRPRDKTPVPARKIQVSGSTNDQPSPRSRDRTPVRKAHVPTNTSPRLSSIPEKNNSGCQKRSPPGTNRKPALISKNMEKQNSSSVVVPLSSTLNKSSSISSSVNEKEAGKSDSSATPTKEPIINPLQEDAGTLDVNENVLQEVESLLEDQKSFSLLESEEQIAQVLSDGDKGAVDVVLTEQEKPLNLSPVEEQLVQVPSDGVDIVLEEHKKPLDLAPVEAGNDNADDADHNSHADKAYNITTDNPSPVEEKEEADAKMQQLEENPRTAEQNFEEEKRMHEIDNTNYVAGSVSDSYPKEENEEEVQVEEAEVVEREKEKEKVADKDETEVAAETVENKEEEVVVEQITKQEEPENAAAQKQAGLRGKKESAVSNDIIEETATKLREQKKNRVRALAGAFESVISSQ